MTKVLEVIKGAGEALANFAKRAMASPKTSAAGVAAIANGIRLLVANPVGFMTNEPAITSLIVGMGLLFAADQAGRKE